MENLYIILFANIIASLSVERVMSVFFGKRKTPLVVTTISYVFFWLTLGLATWIEPTPLTLIIYLLALLVISLNYESPMVKRFSAATAGHFAILIMSAFAVRSVELFPTNMLISATDLAYVSASILIYLLSLLAFLCFKNIKKVTVNLHKVWLPFIILPVAVSFFEFFAISSPAIGVPIIIIGNNIAVFFIFLYLYNGLSKIFEDTLKSKLHSQEKEFYFAQIQLMQESVKKVRSIRHDMDFHLATLKDFSVENKAATDYINSLIGDISESEVYSSTGNIAFDSIINFKLKTAAEDNVKLDLSLFIPSVLNIDVVDVVTIMGNLLDNALDAVAKAEDKIIKLDIEFSKSNLHIKIDNSFDGSVKFADGKDEEEKRIVTLKTGSGHGYGLGNIRKSVEKYNGHMDVSHEGKMFSVGILLYVEDM